MSSNVIRLLPDSLHAARRPLLTHEDICERMGLSYENGYRILHVHGLRIGKRLFITEERLASVLTNEREIE